MIKKNAIELRFCLKNKVVLYLKIFSEKLHINFIFILFANISLAQIQRNIKDEEGNLLSKVNIYFPDQKLLLISDKNGNFSIESNLPDKSLINFISSVMPLKFTHTESEIS